MKSSLIITITAFGLLQGHLSIAQTAAADNKPWQAITFQPIPKGPSFLGAFEGRIPCVGIVPQLKLKTAADCEKLKCRLVLFHDPSTMQPANFEFRIVGGGEVQWQDGHSYRLTNLEGKWSKEKGMPSDQEAEIYVLEPAAIQAKLYLLKGDNNVLFVLDENKGFRTGNENFSYTLNRVELVPGK
ncbi:hypothetical protein [Chitinophaga barathri]|uniref:Uncharacterized protein n=1 Tax=Chitinophaga barathri TaxID=1647451 RepID=A0A3N4MPJ3_9BACT|nr:hypothetical protein [Chitinophaga barathri]RPD42010.1 hypothetical protein EG028_07610 [Chitinophaga barathri]